MAGKRRSTIVKDFGSRDSSSLRNLDREYIKNYRAWRKKSRFGFYIDDSADEMTYQDGIGFIRPDPEAHERMGISRSTNMAMAILILYTVINFLGNIAAPKLLNNVDLNFGSDYFRELIRGSEWAVLLVTFVISLLSRAIPFVLIITVIKMPPSVMMPVKVKNRKMIYMAALPAALMNTCICFLFNQFYLYFLAKTSINTRIVHDLPKNPAILVLTLLSEIIIIPTFGQILINGAGMQLFRQFGDGFAIVVTSLMSAAVCFDLRMMPCIFVNSLIIGYFTLRTGSVMTAIMMRIIVRSASSALVHLSDTSQPGFSWLPLAVFLFVSLFLSFILISIFQLRYSDKMNLDIKETYLTEYEKAMCFLSCPSTMIWLAVCLAVTMFTVPMTLLL